MEPLSRHERVHALRHGKPYRQSEARVRPQAIEHGLRWIALEDPEVLAEHFGERPIRDALSVRQAAPRALKGLRLLLGKPGPELAHQTRLPDSGVTDDRDQSRPALGHRGAICIAQPLELAFPAHESRPQHAHPPWPHQRQSAHEPTARDTVRLPLRRDRFRLSELEGASDDGGRSFSYEDLVRLLPPPRAVRQR